MPVISQCQHLPNRPQEPMHHQCCTHEPCVEQAMGRPMDPEPPCNFEQALTIITTAFDLCLCTCNKHHGNTVGPW